MNNLRTSLHCLFHDLGIANIPLDKMVAGITLELHQATYIAAVGQLIQIDKRDVRVRSQPELDQRRPDEPRSTGDQDPHALGAAHGEVTEAKLLHFGRVVDVTAVDDDGLVQKLLHFFQVQLLELVPFG